MEGSVRYNTGIGVGKFPIANDFRREGKGETINLGDHSAKQWRRTNRISYLRTPPWIQGKSNLGWKRDPQEAFSRKAEETRTKKRKWRAIRKRGAGGNIWNFSDGTKKSGETI